jgi:hypothetical protein
MRCAFFSGAAFPKIAKRVAPIVAKKQCNKLRGAKVHGDLPWRDATVNQHGTPITASPHQWVLAVCCQSLIDGGQIVIRYASLISVIQRLNGLKNAASYCGDLRIR